ncbi:hypothetical protein HAX54_044306 [Datura stramonium]|uniref:Uncharacterized protein n=1 Tax=Datura stramonium TaxID=4076 RepID=A0ABS8W2F9_DATST|nr:hypothetical protein [Datura stramonium]
MRENRGKLGGCYGTPEIMVVWWREQEDEGERIGGFRFGVSGEERNPVVVLVFRLEKMEGFGGVWWLFWCWTDKGDREESWRVCSSEKTRERRKGRGVRRLPFAALLPPAKRGREGVKRQRRQFRRGEMMVCLGFGRVSYNLPGL